MHINELLTVVCEQGASDLHLKVGNHPIARIKGKLTPMTQFKRLVQEDTIAMAYAIMASDKQKAKFKENLDLDSAAEGQALSDEAAAGEEKDESAPEIVTFYGQQLEAGKKAQVESRLLDLHDGFLAQAGTDTGAMLCAVSPGRIPGNIKGTVLSAKGDLAEAGRRLFHVLHEFDQSEVKVIYAEKMPSTGPGRAIMDRLRRAASKGE